MNYVKLTSKIVVEFPESESLRSASFDPSENLVRVTYRSNPDFAYEHEVEGYDEFQSLLDLINELESGYHGYNQWKNERKARLQHRDRVKFDELWESLNDYQRLNFYTWFAEKIEEFDPYYKSPICLRISKQKAPKSWR